MPRLPRHLKHLVVPSSWMLDKLSGTYVSIPLTSSHLTCHLLARLPDHLLVPTNSVNPCPLWFSFATGWSMCWPDVKSLQLSSNNWSRWTEKFALIPYPTSFMGRLSYFSYFSPSVTIWYRHYFYWTLPPFVWCQGPLHYPRHHPRGGFLQPPQGLSSCFGCQGHSSHCNPWWPDHPLSRPSYQG